MLLIKILKDYILIGLIRLSIVRSESHLHQIAFIYKVKQDLYSNDKTICAYHSMQENETEEILVIVQSNALVNPNTVMVELLNAEVADGAML